MNYELKYIHRYLLYNFDRLMKVSKSVLFIYLHEKCIKTIVLEWIIFKDLVYRNVCPFFVDSTSKVNCIETLA